MSDLRTDTVDLLELVDCFLGLVDALLSADVSNWTRISIRQIEKNDFTWKFSLSCWMNIFLFFFFFDDLKTALIFAAEDKEPKIELNW